MLVKERDGVMSRREFPGKVRVAAWERSCGLCENCSRRLSPGDIYFEHRVPCELGGAATLENALVFCKSCWSLKTRIYDHPTIAKAKRIEMRHLGAKRSRNPLPGGRNDKLKKKITGRVVLR